MSHEYAFTPHRSQGPVGIVAKGKGSTSPMSLGIFGGYPGCNVHYYTFRNSNARDLPYDLASTTGQNRENRQWGTFELEDDDIQYICAMGGGGYGDPIDRDPHAVFHDVLLGVISRGVAEEIYGIAIDDKGAVDPDATADNRRAIRSRRAGILVSGNLRARRDVASSGMRINEYLQRTTDGTVQCTWCGDVVAPTGVAWKDRTITRKSPVGNLGPMHTSSDRFFLVEAYCPCCGTLLDVDVGTSDEPLRHDRIDRWAPGAGR
jgi:N-methylhydantoinase B